MGMTAASALDRHIGYWQPYATSHEALDGDTSLQQEVRNTALALLESVRATRTGKQVSPELDIKAPRQK